MPYNKLSGSKCPKASPDCDAGNPRQMPMSLTPEEIQKAKIICVSVGISGMERIIGTTEPTKQIFAF
jgi:hypothetical protein